MVVGTRDCSLSIHLGQCCGAGPRGPYRGYVVLDTGVS